MKTAKKSARIDRRKLEAEPMLVVKIETPVHSEFSWVHLASAPNGCGSAVSLSVPKNQREDLSFRSLHKGYPVIAYFQKGFGAQPVLLVQTSSGEFYAPRVGLIEIDQVV